MKSRLEYALNKRKPFANFRRVIDDTDYLYDWYDFKHERTQLKVWDTIKYEIDELNEEIND